MVKTIRVFAFILPGILLFSCNSTKKNVQEEISLETREDSVNYSVGKSLGKDLGRQNYEWDAEIVAKGIEDALKGEDTIMNDEVAQTLMLSLQQELQQSRQSEMAAKGSENKQMAQQFLAENKQKEGVKETESGLQYKVIEEGSGEMPSASDQVTVHYEGRLIDGTIFDSSYERGEPATFPVNGVIKGWQEALQLMKEGATYELYIPPALGYGSRGAGEKIGPNALLIFKVELIKINNSK